MGRLSEPILDDQRKSSLTLLSSFNALQAKNLQAMILSAFGIIGAVSKCH